VNAAATRSSSKPPTNERKSELAVSYNEFKEYEGQRYTGMKIGRSHTWYYDQGEWKETKITPDLWRIGYAVAKRRAGRAPEGSGVPIGTEYHWYVLAHQHVAGERLHDLTDWAQVQDRAQAGGPRHVERHAENTAQAHDQISAKRHCRSREAGCARRRFRLAPSNACAR
jgi:hypothetical protein